MFDEMSGTTGKTRVPYARIEQWIGDSGLDRLRQRSAEAEAIFRRIGITFAVYGEGGDPERLIPFDLIPRVFAADEWDANAPARSTHFSMTCTIGARF